MNKKFILTHIILIMVAILSSWWLLLSTRAAVNNVTTDLSQPDAIMENVVATVFNQQGQLELKLSTPRILHYEHRDSSDIIQPQFTIYGRSNTPYQISSLYAKTWYETTKITFWDNVVIHRDGNTGSPELTIKTSQADVFLPEQLAMTSEPVEIQQPDTIIHATGLLADFNLGTVKLLSNTQGEYDPSK